MPICLSHLSADAFLEDCAYKGQELEPASTNVLEKCGSNKEDVLEALPESLHLPIDVLVSKDGSRRKNGVVVSHKWTGHLPDGSICAANDGGLYTASAKLCLLQQAGELHLVNLCQMLGRYLGSFTREVPLQKNSMEVQRGPLVDPEELSVYLDQIRGAKNVGALREALQLTCSGAASPQEVNLQLALTLPRRYGGFGLEPPIMNYEIGLDGLAKELCGKGCCRIDLYWPRARFGVEYQGRHHADQLGEDCARHYALHSMDIDLWYVANEQMSSAKQMDCIAREVAKRIGYQTDGRSWPTQAKLQNLLDVLAQKRVPAKNERW